MLSSYTWAGVCSNLLCDHIFPLSRLHFPKTKHRGELFALCNWRAFNLYLSIKPPTIYGNNEPSLTFHSECKRESVSPQWQPSATTSASWHPQHVAYEKKLACLRVLKAPCQQNLALFIWQFIGLLYIKFLIKGQRCSSMWQMSGGWLHTVKGNSFFFRPYISFYTQFMLFNHTKQ